jgi:UDP-4-amino-4,6-dideoxy-N-acetyl-beta-L-altrosamine N-acetyltransferase
MRCDRCGHISHPGLEMEHSAFAIRNLQLNSYFLLSEEEQLKVLSWRNHASVRSVFLQQTEISVTEHIRFIESLKSDQTKRYWMVSHYTNQIGSLDLYRITERDCFWGYFLAPHIQKSSLGLLLEFAVMEIVFDRMGLSVLKCETLAHNENALKIHRQFGYRETRQEDGRVYMEMDAAIWKEKKQMLEDFIELLLR